MAVQGVDASYYITLTATFYRSTLLAPKATTADLILPLTNLANSFGPDAYSTPPDANTSITLPRNVKQAWVEITASGNCEPVPRSRSPSHVAHGDFATANEEFWYINVPDKWVCVLISPLEDVG